VLSAAVILHTSGAEITACAPHEKLCRSPLAAAGLLSARAYCGPVFSKAMCAADIFSVGRCAVFPRVRGAVGADILPI
jgi:hypothetical protein